MAVDYTFEKRRTLADKDAVWLCGEYWPGLVEARCELLFDEDTTAMEDHDLAHAVAEGSASQEDAERFVRAWIARLSWFENLNHFHTEDDYEPEEAAFAFGYMLCFADRVAISPRYPQLAEWLGIAVDLMIDLTGDIYCLRHMAPAITVVEPKMPGHIPNS